MGNSQKCSGLLVMMISDSGRGWKQFKRSRTVSLEGNDSRRCGKQLRRIRAVGLDKLRIREMEETATTDEGSRP